MRDTEKNGKENCGDANDQEIEGVRDDLTSKINLVDSQCAHLLKIQFMTLIDIEKSYVSPDKMRAVKGA